MTNYFKIWKVPFITFNYVFSTKTQGYFHLSRITPALFSQSSCWC